MRNRLGIRREDKSLWERRTPLTPEQIRGLRQASGLEFVVQPSTNRVFTDMDFESAGASVSEDLSDCRTIVGVKEMPVGSFEPGKVYLFFAHVIKGQPYNMPMLQRLVDLGCTLIDYEKIVDAQNQRLIAFGRFAGLAGMIDALWALGRRLEWEGVESPFADIEKAIHYPDLEAAKSAIREVGRRIESHGLPECLAPFVCGFAGYGKVSNGAQEIFDLLPVKEIEPVALLAELETPARAHHVHKVVFREEHLVQPKSSSDRFELLDYYDHPEKYVSRFEHFLPHLTVLMNCVYWEARYPRLVTKGALKKIYDPSRMQPRGQHQPQTTAGSPLPRLRVIGDISCDIEGGIEATMRATTPGDPVYVYDPFSDQIQSGWEGVGPVILAVDILPTELPVEASTAFGEALSPFMPALANADFDADFGDLSLPPELKRAVIAHQGHLAPDYRYLAGFVASSRR